MIFVAFWCILDFLVGNKYILMFKILTAFGGRPWIMPLLRFVAVVTLIRDLCWWFSGPRGNSLIRPYRVTLICWTVYVNLQSISFRRGENGTGYVAKNIRSVFPNLRHEINLSYRLPNAGQCGWAQQHPIFFPTHWSQHWHGPVLEQLVHTIVVVSLFADPEPDIQHGRG